MMRLKFGFGLARNGVFGVDEDIDLICVNSGDASEMWINVLSAWIKTLERKRNHNRKLVWRQFNELSECVMTDTLNTNNKITDIMVNGQHKITPLKECDRETENE